MPKVFTSEKQKIGEMGETIAEKFLVKQGFSVLDRNYTKKWGEIDIVAKKANKIYFIEVKSVSHLPYGDESNSNDNYNPEDNMHPWKMKRLARTIQTYLLDKKVDDDIEWQVDLLIVYLDLKTQKSEVKVVNDLIL
jgi:putative endonuclease